MTDNEIKKALECCCKNNNCEGCPLDCLAFLSQCTSELAIKSLDLINRLQAENERLTHITRNLIGEIKAEAYKEFAEKLKEEAMQKFDWNEYVEVEDIDNFLKEMVGEDNVD